MRCVDELMVLCATWIYEDKLENQYNEQPPVQKPSPPPAGKAGHH